MINAGKKHDGADEAEVDEEIKSHTADLKANKAGKKFYAIT